MSRIFYLILLTTILNAQNPEIYSALGNIVYDNVKKIDDLKETDSYKNFKQRIKIYVRDANLSKEMGFAIDRSSINQSKKEYLNGIRKLSKTNDFFYRLIRNDFIKATKNGDNQLFLTTINSGLLDTKKYKDEILKYYFLHCKKINTAKVIQNFLDEDLKLKAQQKRLKTQKHTKKQLQEAKIKRLRKRDKLKQEALQKSLEKELLEKNNKIREEQVQEILDLNLSK